MVFQSNNIAVMYEPGVGWLVEISDIMLPARECTKVNKNFSVTRDWNMHFLSSSYALHVLQTIASEELYLFSILHSIAASVSYTPGVQTGHKQDMAYRISWSDSDFHFTTHPIYRRRFSFTSFQISRNSFMKIDNWLYDNFHLNSVSIFSKFLKNWKLIQSKECDSEQRY